MNCNRFFASAAALLLATVLASPSHAAIVTLFADNFDYAGSTTNSPSTTKWASPYQGYSATTNAYPAGGTAKLGKSSAPTQGSLTTTNLTIQAGTLNVQVSGVAYDSDERTLQVVVAGPPATFTFTAMLGEPLQTVSADFAVQAGTYAVTFYSPKRVLIDNILITQVVSDEMAMLPAPVAYEPTGTTDTSFTAAWSSVANAESYQVSVWSLTVNGSTTNATSIAGSPFTVAAGTTTFSATSLTQNSLYRFSVVAVGNGTTTGNSPDSNAITVRTATSAIMPIFTVAPGTVPAVEELSPVAFTISATVGGNPASVSYVGGLPSGASYTFSGGAFAWTPALGQAGVYPLDFTAPGGDGLTYTNTVAITVNALPLTAPVNLAASNIGPDAFDLSWDAVPAATQGYVVSVWTGSSATNTPDVDLETFFETTDSNPVQPLGWAFTGIVNEYMDKGLNEVGFNDTGDTLTTRLYPEAVTSLTFRVQSRSTTSLGDSVLAVAGSVDGTTWTPLASYTTATDSDGDDENNLFSTGTSDVDKRIVLNASSGYRQFQFVFTKGKYNAGIGNIGAMYAGAGTRFASGWDSTVVAGTTASVGSVRPSRIYYVGVAAWNAVERKESLLRFSTLEAPRTTVIVVQ